MDLAAEVRVEAPFQPVDLAELDERLLARAAGVARMDDVYDHSPGPDVIGLRHDVDWDLDAAVLLAAWEHERGYRSSYYILHTAPYWADKPRLVSSLDRIAEYGHEIGLHLDAVAAALVNRRDPLTIFEEALAELRGYHYRVRSVVGHGNAICHVSKFANDELFVECARPALGEPDRTLEYGSHRLQLQPVSRAEFGLDFDPVWLPRAFMLSDSGGRWSPSTFDEACDRFPDPDGRMHFLWHCDWWSEAL